MPTNSQSPNAPLTPQDLKLIDAWWRAANYLSIGQIYLLDNPLLKEPLTLKHIKPRLLGHWGTTPGLNFIYVHLGRAIKARDLDMIYVAGPGHGGPGLVANAWLEGTYSEFYPHVPQTEVGMRRLFKQFSFPGGIPSHAAPETPGSMHEGGELGYALSHAYGAAFDNPDLVVSCVVGDGEAETGPMAASWHSNKFLNPATDGAVLPILHLNGYKIANPTILARIGDEELRSLFVGYGYEPHMVAGDDPAIMHQLMASTVDIVLDKIRRDSARRTQRPFHRAAALAHDHPEDTQRLDRSQDGGWSSHGRILAIAPGPVRGNGDQTGTRESASGMDEELPAGRPVRRDRPATSRDSRDSSHRGSPHERQPTRQWHKAAARTRPARGKRLCRGRGSPGREGRRGNGRDCRLLARHSSQQCGEAAISAYSARMR